MATSLTARIRPTSQASLAKRLFRYRYMYLLLVPGLLILITFDLVPLYFLQVAFKKFNIFSGLEGSSWNGLANFEALFSTKYFLQAFTNTVILSLMIRILAFPVPIILALLLNEIRQKSLKQIFQTLIYLPHFLSWVIVSGIWIAILSPSGGLVNEIITVFGGTPHYFMIDSEGFRWLLLIQNIWKESGWATIVFLAALAGVDPQLYEAARIDGASRWQQVLKVTIPSILPVILVVFVLSLAKVFNVFEQVFTMYNPVVADVSETLDTYIYQVGLKQGNIALGTTVGLFKNVITLSLVLLTNHLVKRYQDNSVI